KVAVDKARNVPEHASLGVLDHDSSAPRVEDVRWIAGLDGCLDPLLERFVVQHCQFDSYARGCSFKSRYYSFAESLSGIFAGAALGKCPRSIGLGAGRGS